MCRVFMGLLSRIRNVKRDEERLSLWLICRGDGDFPVSAAIPNQQSNFRCKKRTMPKQNSRQTVEGGSKAGDAVGILEAGSVMLIQSLALSGGVVGERVRQANNSPLQRP